MTASRITQYVNSVDGTSDYNYDNGNQVTDATYDFQSDEAYDYDENGNRTNTGYATGFYNRLTSDGTFDYEYDDEGNRTKRTNIATGEVTDYAWDYRNRLVTVTDRVSDGGAITQTVSHRYDAFNRWISKTVDTDGDGPQAGETTRYEYDGNQIVLAIDDAGNISNRYLWGPVVDQLFADEQTGGEVLWALTDQLGTVRDLVDDTGTVVNHITYDSFGNVTSETDAAIDELFGYTGKALDESTGLQNNLNRWYDAAVGRWASEDPISFGGGDANLFRYVGNSSVVSVDPSGMIIETGWDIGNAIYDVGRLAKNAAESAWDASKYAYHSLRDNPDARDQAAQDLRQDAGEFGEALLDLGVDAACTLIPGVPAGGSKALRAADKANDAKKAADKAKDARKAAEKFSKEKQELVDMAKKDKRKGMTKADMEAYKDLNKQLPDPFPTNKVRGPEAHPSRSPHSQQSHGHVGPVNHIPITD